MDKLSLRKIAAIIIGIIALCNLKEILRAFGRIYEWFADSLWAIRDFPEGAQTAIAILLIVLVVVLIAKAMNK